MNYEIVNMNNIKYITFAKFRELEKDILYYFTARSGGVSKNYYNSLNLGLVTRDTKNKINEYLLIKNDTME